MSKINEIIVSQIPDKGEPCTAYLLDNGDGTHDRYVSDENGNISKQAGGINTIQAGANITIDNTDPKNPLISSNDHDCCPPFDGQLTQGGSDISSTNPLPVAITDNIFKVEENGTPELLLTAGIYTKATILTKLSEAGYTELDKTTFNSVEVEFYDTTNTTDYFTISVAGTGGNIQQRNKKSFGAKKYPQYVECNDFELTVPEGVQVVFRCELFLGEPITPVTVAPFLLGSTIFNINQ